MPPRTVWTIGHSTHTLDEFLAMLRAFGVETLVDVRTMPRSRRHPQFNTESLAASLPAAAVGYRHIPSLGGLRSPPKGGAESPNIGWKHTGFRNFADHALTPAFREGLGELMALAEERPTAIMCAEGVWRKCHRRLIADYLLVRGVPVVHIMGAAKSEAATLTPFAAPQADGSILYPAPNTSEGGATLWTPDSEEE